MKLVLRQRLGKLFLAAWPDQASKHAVDCPFFTDLRSGVQDYAPGAIEQQGELTRIALHHAIRQPGLDRGEGARPNEAERNEKLRIWGLLHYLWEEAGLNRWHPGWHRDWGFARAVLRRVAQTTHLAAGVPLLPNLYVPPVWVAARKSEIRANWEQFTAPLLAQHRGTASVMSGFVIGTVRSLEVSEFGHVLRLQHHAERFYIDKNISELLARFSRRGWVAAKGLTQDTRTHVIAAIRIQATASGRFAVIEAALMRVSSRLIPVANAHEEKLADRLIADDRRFLRPLHYDSLRMNLPSFVLKDAELPGDKDRPRDVAMYVYSPSLPEAQKARAKVSDQQWAEHNDTRYWSWDVVAQPEGPQIPHAAAAQREIPAPV